MSGAPGISSALLNGWVVIVQSILVLKNPVVFLHQIFILLLPWMSVLKLPLISCAHQETQQNCTTAILQLIVTIILKGNTRRILIHGETRNWVFYFIFSLKGKYANLTGKYQVFFYSNITINLLWFWQEANFIHVLQHMTRVVCFSSLRFSLWPVSVGGSEYLEMWTHFSHRKVIPLWVEFTPQHYDMVHVKSKCNKLQGL